jgi:hypothetical protein
MPSIPLQQAEQALAEIVLADGGQGPGTQLVRLLRPSVVEKCLGTPVEGLDLGYNSYSSWFGALVKQHAHVSRVRQRATLEWLNRNKRHPDTDFTHTSLWGGKLFVTDKQQFREDLAHDLSRNIMHALVEWTPVDQRMRYFIDLDIKLQSTDTVLDIMELTRSLQQIVEPYFPHAKQRRAVLSTTSPVSSATGVKYAAHIIFPDYGVTAAEAEELAEHAQEALHQKYPGYDWDQIVDANVYSGKRGRLRLNGSVKVAPCQRCATNAHRPGVRPCVDGKNPLIHTTDCEADWRGTIKLLSPNVRVYTVQAVLHHDGSVDSEAVFARQPKSRTLQQAWLAELELTTLDVLHPIAQFWQPSTLLRAGGKGQWRKIRNLRANEQEIERDSDHFAMIERIVQTQANQNLIPEWSKLQLAHVKRVNTKKRKIIALPHKGSNSNAGFCLNKICKTDRNAYGSAHSSNRIRFVIAYDKRSKSKYSLFQRCFCDCDPVPGTRRHGKCSEFQSQGFPLRQDDVVALGLTHQPNLTLPDLCKMPETLTI